VAKHTIAFGIEDAAMIAHALREWESWQGNHDYHPEHQAKLDPRLRDPKAAEKLAAREAAIEKNRRMRNRILRHFERLMAKHEAT
jgi:glutathione S-transferase